MTTMMHFPSVRTAAWLDEPLLLPLAGLNPDQAMPIAGLHMRVLHGQERGVIADLRRYAAVGVEQDLGLGLAPFEQTRDDIGLVTAVYRNARPLATIRFVPTGHGLTGAERLLQKIPFDDSILGDGSWEVGRMIMAPQDRHPDLLLECLTVTLEELIQLKDVRHFHATTTLAMARMWRRIGVHTVVTAVGASGANYALVHGRIEDVAAALHLPLPLREPATPLQQAVTGVSPGTGAGPLVRDGCAIAPV